MRAPVAALLLAGVAACAPPGRDAPVAGAAGRVALLPLEEAAARLPAAVEGFTRGDAVWHERERPGQGMTLDYAGPARSAVATVSLYDRGGGPVADDAAARLEGEFTESLAEAMASAGRRTAQRITERERSTLPVPGGAPLSCARLDGLYGRQEVRTLLCLGVAAGRFVKVQVTSPARQVRAVDPVPFVVGVTQAARG